MRIVARIFLFYCTLVATFLSISGFLNARSNFELITQAFFLPVTLYFIIASISSITKGEEEVTLEGKRVYLIISFVILMLLSGISIFNIYFSL